MFQKTVTVNPTFNLILQICNGFVISHVTVMEEHTRSHLTQPSYRCSARDCTLQHHSKNFLTRHMKEVHKYKQTPTDIIELDPSLKKEFCKIAFRCFPSHFSDHLSSFHIFRRSPISRSPLLKSLTETNWCIPSTCSATSAMQNANLSMSSLTSTLKTFNTPSLKPTSSLLTAILPLNLTLQTPAARPNDVALLLPTTPVPSSKDMSHFKDLMNMSSVPAPNSECKPFVFHAAEHSSSKCITLTSLLAAAPKNNLPQARIQPTIHPPISRKTCSFCQDVFEGEYLVLYKHVKKHLSLLPYECSVCKFADVDRKIVEEHISHDHLKATLIDRMTDSISRQCSALFTACFPDVPLQPSLHDNVQK
uniref:C2H2-type domain-containing protein n=1 Tax=Elaeophora elaphi TaxID=1147741 RepID=A0A0R3S1N6_9BILA